MRYIDHIKTKTPVGEFHMFAGKEEDDKDLVVRTAGFGLADEVRERLPASFRSLEVRAAASDHPYAHAIRSYFDGKLSALNGIPYEQEGGSFSRVIWNAMRTVVAGSTISYKELAAHAGNPAAVRAAGTACGKNKIILIVPCHRIIKSDGQLGNYLYGPSIKAWLLAHEAKYKHTPPTTQ
jgi:methylated-DNA-[protein]-cysteine S-methyltransferase